MKEKTLVVSTHQDDDIGGAPLRIRQLLHTLSREGHPVIHWAPTRRGPWHRLVWWQRLLLAPFVLPLWRDSYVSFMHRMSDARRLRALLREWRPQRVILTELWSCAYLGVLREYRKDNPRVRLTVDLHNIESILMMQMASRARGPKRTILWHRARLLWDLERTARRVADDFTVTTENDSRLWHHMHGVHCRIVPNAYPVHMVRKVTLTRDRSIGYIGVFGYRPNREAAWRLVRMLPWLGGDVILHLVGPDPDPAWEDIPGVVVHGEVDDIGDVMPLVRTMVMPITTGGGSRLKVPETMAYGVPLVATSKAVEGHRPKSGRDYLSADTDEGMIAAINMLWDNPGYEEEIAKNARHLAKLEMGWEVAPCP